MPSQKNHGVSDMNKAGEMKMIVILARQNATVLVEPCEGVFDLPAPAMASELSPILGYLLLSPAPVLRSDSGLQIPAGQCTTGSQHVVRKVNAVDVLMLRPVQSDTIRTGIFSSDMPLALGFVVPALHLAPCLQFRMSFLQPDNHTSNAEQRHNHTHH